MPDIRLDVFLPPVCSLANIRCGEQRVARRPESCQQKAFAAVPITGTIWNACAGPDWTAKPVTNRRSSRQPGGLRTASACLRRPWGRYRLRQPGGVARTGARYGRDRCRCTLFVPGGRARQRPHQSAGHARRNWHFRAVDRSRPPGQRHADLFTGAVRGCGTGVSTGCASLAGRRRASRTVARGGQHLPEPFRYRGRPAPRYMAFRHGRRAAVAMKESFLCAVANGLMRPARTQSNSNEHQSSADLAACLF